MSGANSFGRRFVLTTFGESHGAALGAVIDGVPAGITWDQQLLLNWMERRRPGRSASVSGRAESDIPEVLSGVYDGKTLGTPIAMMVRNQDARSQDYSEIAMTSRFGHADDVWKIKFGHTDPRGGGRSSGRETVARVMGGAVAQMVLKTLMPSLSVTGFMRQVGPLVLADNQNKFTSNERSDFEKKVEDLLVKAKSEGQSWGGIAELWIDGVPAGIGQPVFHKLKSDLAISLLSVGATNAIEIGDGFAAASAEGSQFHQPPIASEQVEHALRYGGIRGGISTGERIVIRVGFKPTSSVLDIAKRGRHDPCIVPRAIPVLEAMVHLVLVDHAL